MTRSLKWRRTGVDATEAPFDANYRMYSYVLEDLPAVVGAHFPLRMWIVRDSGIPWAGMARW